MFEQSEIVATVSLSGSGMGSVSVCAKATVDAEISIAKVRMIAKNFFIFYAPDLLKNRFGLYFFTFF
jgi:hypothetical protein